MKSSKLGWIIGIGIAAMLCHGLCAKVSAQVAEESVEREEKRLKRQIKQNDEFCDTAHQSNRKAREMCEQNIDQIKNRLRLLQADPEQYFHDQRAISDSTTTRPPTGPPDAQSQRPMQGPDGTYYPDGAGGYVGPGGKRLY